jgi:transposase
MRSQGSAQELERRRRLAVTRVLEGYRAAQVAAFLGVSLRSVERWLKVCGPKGNLDALQAKPVPGRPRRLSARQEKRVKANAERAHLVLIEESGFFLNPLLRRTWARKGRTPILRRFGRHRDKVSVVAAISVAAGRRRVGLYFQPMPSITSTRQPWRRS